MEKTIRVCDGCGKTEEVGNHWFQTELNGTMGIAICRGRFGPISGAPQVRLYDHCGQQCLILAISKWADEGESKKETSASE